jgi:hypothetical protein
MREQDRRRDLRQRQNPAYDRVVVACRTNGQLLALVQAAGKAPARLVLESEEMLLHAAPNVTSVWCRCAAGQHTLDVFRYQTEVYRQDGDRSARRPVHISV